MSFSKVEGANAWKCDDTAFLALCVLFIACVPLTNNVEYNSNVYIEATAFQHFLLNDYGIDF